jgi:hypothetical protein
LQLKKSEHQVHKLNITCGREIRCGEGLGCVWGEADQSVEVVGGGGTQDHAKAGFLAPSDRYGAYTLIIGCGKEIKCGGDGECV